jgi:hypothetical protein
LQRGLQRRHAFSKLASQLGEALFEGSFHSNYSLFELRDFVHLSSFVRA